MRATELDYKLGELDGADEISRHTISHEHKWTSFLFIYLFFNPRQITQKEKGAV